MEAQFLPSGDRVLTDNVTRTAMISILATLDDATASSSINRILITKRTLAPVIVCLYASGHSKVATRLIGTHGVPRLDDNVRDSLGQRQLNLCTELPIVPYLAHIWGMPPIAFCPADDALKRVCEYGHVPLLTWFLALHGGQIARATVLAAALDAAQQDSLHCLQQMVAYYGITAEEVFVLQVDSCAKSIAEAAVDGGCISTVMWLLMRFNAPLARAKLLHARADSRAHHPTTQRHLDIMKRIDQYYC